MPMISPTAISPHNRRGGINWSTYWTPSLKEEAIPAATTFSEDCTNDYIKGVVTDIKMYGADPTHQYFISFFETKLTRRQFIISDLTTGKQICSRKITSTITEEQLRALPETWKLNDLNVGPTDGYNSVYAVIKIKWADVTLTQNIYTTLAQGGIDTAAVFSKAMIADFKTRHIYHEKITVGSGKDYETLTAAIESLFYTAGTMNPVVYNLTVQRYDCWRSCYHNQILIEIDEGNFDCEGLYVPEFVMLKGAGKDLTILTGVGTNENPPLEINWETKIAGLTVVSNTGDDDTWIGEYAIHSDDFNYVSKHGNRKIIQLYESCKFIGGMSQNTWLFGCGISSDEEVIFYDCEGGHLNETYRLTKPTFGVHSTSESLYPALLRFEKCASSDVYGAAIQETDPVSGQTNICQVTGTDFPELEDEAGWDVQRI